MQKHSNHLLTTLIEAIADGFIHHFYFSPEGNLSVAGMEKQYEAPFERSFPFKNCIECGWTIFLITAPDGVRGTLVEFHEDH